MRKLGIDADGPWVRRDTTRLTRPNKSQLAGVWEARGTIKAVAIESGISQGKAVIWLAEVGIFLRPEPAISRHDLLAAIRSGQTVRQIASEQGVTDSTVTVELTRHGLVEQHRNRPA